MNHMRSKPVSRRGVIKGAGAMVAATLGPDLVTGFPAVHSQEPKVLRYLGTSNKISPEWYHRSLEYLGKPRNNL